MTFSESYRAPFAPGGPAGIDNEICQRLLSVALAKGGDYADLFFEYRAAGGLVFDEGILKSASRGVSMGLGVRVQRGDATGYAYVEDLSWEAMKRAAETASQIASGGGGTARGQAPRRPSVGSLRSPTPRSTQPAPTKRALLERASLAAHALRPLDHQGRSELRRGDPQEIRARHQRRQVRSRRAAALSLRRAGHRREGAEAPGGVERRRRAHDPRLFRRQGARVARRRGGAPGRSPCSTHAKRPPARFEVVSAPGDSGILLHEAVGHGLEADFNRKGTSNYTGKIGQNVASSLCTVVDDATLLQSRGTINVDDEGHEPSRSVLIEEVSCAATCTTG